MRRIALTLVLVLTVAGCQPSGSDTEPEVAEVPTVSEDATGEMAEEALEGPKPTYTTLPTYTPFPTYTSPPPLPTHTTEPETDDAVARDTALPEETDTAALTGAATTSSVLFADSFERGVDPAWHMRGGGFSSTQGQLWIENGWVESTAFQDESWGNISVRLIGVDFQDLSSIVRLRIRVLDRDNYMELYCWRYDDCAWQRVVNGEEKVIPGTTIELPNNGDLAVPSYETVDAQIVAEDSEFRFFSAGKQRIRFIDDTFSKGGFVMRLEGSLTVDAIEIKSLE